MKGDDHVELVERLVGLGLDEREAKLYLHLALGGPSRASDAAAATRLKRTETYRALEVLMRRGFVTSRLEKPVVYEANAPDAVFGDLLAGHEQRRHEIEKLRDRVSEAVADARQGSGRESGKHGYKILQGRRAILRQANTMLRQADTLVSLASTTLSPASFTPQNQAWQTFVKRAADGLETRLLVRPTPGIDEGLKVLDDAPRADVRAFDPPGPIRFMMVDDREVVFWLVTDAQPGVEGRDDVAMWTNAPDFVRAQRQLFDALWRDGKRFR